MPNSNRIEVKPSLNELRRRHSAALKKMRNMPIAHGKISIFLDSWVQRNFKSEGTLVGGWKPLDPRTRADTNPKILQDTGRLKASFFPFATKKNAGVASDLPYSKFHEKGEGVPKRRMLPKIKEVRAGIDKIYRGHVNYALKEIDK